MRYLVDMLYPPTRDQASTMVNLGWKGCMVYIGGPRAMARDTWKIVDGVRAPVGNIADIFEEFEPMYVGRNVGDDPNNPWDRISSFTYSQGQIDGDEANELAGSCGFDSSAPVGLDLEYGSFQAHPINTQNYVAGFASRINGAGHKFILYSDPYTISHIGGYEIYDYAHTASYLRSARGMQEAPDGRFDPRQPPPWDLWQFGNSTIGGVSVDLNSIADDVVLAKYAL